MSLTNIYVCHRIQLIVITYHIRSREQIPQEPKSMISLNHQAPVVNQTPCFSITALQGGWLFPGCTGLWTRSLSMLSVQLVGLCGSYSDSTPWTPTENMHVTVIGLTKSNFQFSVAARKILI